MPWWNEIIALVREEFRGEPGQQGPQTIHQASDLLERTGRDIALAQARAEAARRRLLRAQAELESLTRTARQDVRYGERLVELARVVSHESDLVASFDAHIAQLKQLGETIAHQLRRLQNDSDTVAAAQAAGRTAKAAPAGRATKRAASAERRPAPSTEGAHEVAAGFRHKRPERALENLKRVDVTSPGDQSAPRSSASKARKIVPGDQRS